MILKIYIKYLMQYIKYNPYDCLKTNSNFFKIFLF